MVAHQLRAFAGPAEGLGSLPSTCTVPQIHLMLSSDLLGTKYAHGP